MPIIDGRTWMQHLSPADCWRRLDESEVGRLAVVVDGDPEIFPVNHVVDGHSIVFRTDPGSKLRGIRREAVVCFEVDQIDVGQRNGWSVVIKGHATEVTDATESRAVRNLPLDYWALGDKVHFIRITPVVVTGREIVR